MLGASGLDPLEALRKYTNRSSRGGALHHNRVEHPVGFIKSWMSFARIVTRAVLVEHKHTHEEATMSLSLMPATIGQWDYDGSKLGHADEDQRSQRCHL